MEELEKDNFCESLLLCKENLKPIGRKVRSRCNLAGIYEEAAQQSCILIVKQSRFSFVRVLYHKFSKSDPYLSKQY